MRYLIDIICIIIFLVVGTALFQYQENLHDISQQIGDFEKAVADNTILEEDYSNEHATIRQVEENRAGEFAKQISEICEEIGHATFSLTNGIMESLLKK